MALSFRRSVQQGQIAGSRFQIALPRNVLQGQTGSHLSRDTGASLEFKDHREYQPGDDLRRIDWSAFGRSDKLTVKLYRDEVHPFVELMLDTSASMALEGSEKSAASIGLSAAVAAAAENSGFSHSVWLAKEHCELLPAGGDSPEHWQEFPFVGQSNPHTAMTRRPPTWKPRSIRVLISDLFWIDDPLHTLEPMSRGSAAVFVVQVVAKNDLDPPTDGNVRLLDSESNQYKEVFIDKSARARYKEAFARHQEHWHQATRQVGGILTTIVAEDFVTSWNLGELVRSGILAVN